jgi:Bacteriodetes cell division protein (FtsL-like)
MNKVKEVEAEIKAEPKKPNKQARKFIRALNVMDLIDKASLIRFMPYIFFLTGLAVIYIANSYIAENTIRNIDRNEREIKELRSEYISGKSELMVKSKQTEVAKSVSSIGIKESTTAPRKIIDRTTKQTK